MKKILQDLRSGKTMVQDIPRPKCMPGHVLIRTNKSLISAGTERKLVEFGRANILSKAQSRPDKVEQVLNKLKTDGLLPTMEAVFSRLEEPLPLGYCNAGTVIEVGEGVNEFSVGDRVVSNGPHAEVVSVPKNICARIPDSVSNEEAAFTVLASIALQGVRLADPSLGERVAVLGLGLIGLLTVQILEANGCQVIGTDFDQRKLSLAEEFGAETVNLSNNEDPVQAGLNFSGGKGIDKILITAATESSDPIRQAAQMSRKRGKIVLIGVTGLDLRREDFYEKELTFQVSCSYGPGRYDPEYEEKGHDYPFGFVRWTEQRNFQAVLQLIKENKLDVTSLISKKVPLGEAPSAYKLLLDDPAQLGITLEYPNKEHFSDIIPLSDHKEDQVYRENDPVVGVIGAGNFASRVLLPAIKKGQTTLHTLASAGGVSAAVYGNKFGFKQAATDPEIIFNDPKINTIFIATRHNLHAEMVIRGLNAKKHVFVEKPLAINKKELSQIDEIRKENPDLQLMVGFNRRFSPLALRMKELVQTRTQPMTMIYTVNAGYIPPDHWSQNPEIGGGRIIGEACHFIDFFRFLVDRPIQEVNSQMVGAASGIEIREDKMSINLTFEDGSIGTIHYFANGSKRFPKERVEVFAEGGILILDNFKKLKGYGWPRFRQKRVWRQDKGHNQEVREFLRTVSEGGEPLIPWSQIKEVAVASFSAVKSAQNSRQI